MERRFLAGLAGQLAGAFETLDWVGRRGWHEALTHVHDNRSIARDIAARIASWRADEPQRPLIVTCQSGGAGMLAFALEVLEPTVHVDGVVMIAPALSPRYNLSRALSRIAGSCVALVSRHDGLALGPGTALFGTIDGRHEHAAGRVGFKRPAGVPAAAYGNLVQVPYSFGWLRRYGHAGGHNGGMSRRFAAGYLAPILAEMSRRVARATGAQSSSS